MLLKEIKNIFHKELDPQHGKDEVDSFFYLLVEYLLGLDRFILALEPNLMISKEREEPIFKALAQLKLARPIQYIIGHTHFMGLKLAVDERVLIPRPETEELVSWIISDILEFKTSGRSSRRILDIGTGSGCIAIALKKQFPGSLVYGLDISEDALLIARSNAEENEVEVDFFAADILISEQLEGTFDIIVSNPPYVRDLEKETMSSNVTEYEPDTALYVTNEAPLVFYEKIATLAAGHLKMNGAVYFEINQYLGEEIQQLLSEIGFFEIEMRKDIFDNNRMLKAVWKGSK